MHVKRSVCDASKKRKARCTAVVEPENAVKRRKALGLLSEEELLVRNLRDKVRKVSKRASETRERTLHRQEQNRTHMASISTYHLACAEGSALQCCSFLLHSGNFWVGRAVKQVINLKWP